MKGFIFYSYLTLLFGSSSAQTSSNAQTKVASFSIGKYGSEKYEHYSFWVRDGKRSDIEYTYGVNQKDIKLKYLGTHIFKGDSCFSVQFPNKYILYIISVGLHLKITDEKGNYLKTFSWEYEGPINGIGTFCELCAESEADAMQLLKRNFLKQTRR